MRAALLLLAMLGACVRPDLTECGGTYCSSSTMCLAEEPRCVDPLDLDITTRALAFPEVACGSTQAATVTLTNHGEAPIAFTARSTSQVIHATPEEGVVEPASSVVLTVIADPGAASIPGVEVNGVLQIATATSSHPVALSMSSSGAVATVSGTLDFGETGINIAKQRVIKVRNDGTVPLTASIGDLPPYVTAIAETSATIAPRDEARFSFQFLSPAVADFSGTASLALGDRLCGPFPTSLDVRAIASGDELLLDRTTIEYPPIDCDAATLVDHLGLTNNMATPQVVTITNTNPRMFSVPGSVTIPALSTSLVTIVRGSTKAADEPGRQDAVITFTGAKTKTLTILQEIVAPQLSVSLETLTLTPDARTGVITVRNKGNGVGIATLEPPVAGNISASPSSFQISPDTTVPITFTASPSNVAASLRGLLRAAGACSESVRLDVNYSTRQLF